MATAATPFPLLCAIVRWFQVPKFRKKPVIIDAVQFDGSNDPTGVGRREDGEPFVVTIHGQRCYIEAGDWIIPEPDGVHYYPCKAAVFAAIYEAV